MFHYLLARLMYQLKLGAYRRICPACGRRAFSWVHRRDGPSICYECYRKENVR